jgi:cell division protein FtsL
MFIAKHIDNTRLVKADDPDRRSEMISFASVLTLLFALTMVYVWQHFSAIEVGYSVEVHKLQVDRMRESNRELMLMEAELSDPNRIDHISRQLGMDNPAPDQVARQDRPSGTVIAQAQTVALPTN